MFEKIKEAGLTPDHVAKIVGVSRVTASRWLNGHFGVHRLLNAKVQRLLDAVERGLQAGDFPLPPDVPRAMRLMEIKAVLRKHIKPSS